MSDYHDKPTSELGIKHQLIRLLWTIVWAVFARPLPRSVGHEWRRCLLRLFGAKMSSTSFVYSSARIYYPKNLIMEDHTQIGPEVDCYNVDKIILKQGASISQKSYLCTASHKVDEINGVLISAPIVIEKDAWVAADAFIGMGVTIGEGALVGARAAVFKDVEPWTIVGGNPAKVIKSRTIRDCRISTTH